MDKSASMSRKGAEFKAFFDVQMLSYNNSNEVSNAGSGAIRGENPKKRKQNVKMWITWWISYPRPKMAQKSAF